MNRRPHICHNLRPQTSGFTLVEVMISIALALVLILGISQIFSMAQHTTGAGTQMLSAIQTNRAVQERLSSDFLSMTNGAGTPGLTIVSYASAAYRTPEDRRNNRVADPRRANDPTSSTGSLAAYSATDVNSRVHRLDRICFFARGLFTRQTGNPGTGSASSPLTLTSATTSSEAYIWLGHLKLPTNATVNAYDGRSPQNGTYYGPAENTLTNDQNNFYASDFILGRVAVLLLPSASIPTGESSYPASPNALSLLNGNNKTNNAPFYTSRYDLAATSIATYANFVSGSQNWWTDVAGYDPSTNPPKDQRFWANPFVKKPTSSLNSTQMQQWLSGSVAQTSPIFVRGCTQFIVEYAGNFTTQNQDPGSSDYGKVTAAVPDPSGKIDFVAERVGKDAGGNPTYANHIRWYGFPRDTNADGTIDVTHDVVPLDQVLAYYGISKPTLPTGVSWPERAVPSSYTLPAQGTGSSPYSSAYVCAWGQDTDAAGIPRPKMIRITLAVDDPSGNLNSEQTYEYVFNLP